MIAFGFSFPAGRYHATPWGRHANEADVAWPPEPVRILRGLIATWWRKADYERFPKAMLDDLINVLASELPVFYLPPAVHSHVRAYMPAPADKKLIYDAFLRFDRDAELIVAWPDAVLTTDQKDLCSHLLDRIGYIGRSESWACGRLIENWNGQPNCVPRGTGSAPAESVPVDVLVPLPPAEWTTLRAQLLARSNGEKKTRRGAKMKSGLLAGAQFACLSEALSVDTSDWQNEGWSSPPPLRKEVYDRPAIGPVVSSWRRKTRVPPTQPGTPELARFVLAGRPQPRIEEALRIGELARVALMSGGGDPPLEFSGRNADGPQRDDPAHAHAFFLPEDADNDGLIDHLLIFCRHGFSLKARQRLDSLSKLWLAHGRVNDDGERGRKEWRLALEDISAPGNFASESALLRSSRTWVGLTPYLMPWHTKRNFGPAEQIKREMLRRGYQSLPEVTALAPADTGKRAIRFRRNRSRRGLVQPDPVGCFLKLTFPEPVVGPLAFGFGCHYGLGLFVADKPGGPS